jgi:hypothetical protein
MMLPYRDLGIGDMIGECYRVEQIYPGGMGIVYRVREAETGQIFAIKPSSPWPQPSCGSVSRPRL